jgi:hypothetical protein
MLETVAEVLEQRVLPPAEHRPSTSTVVGMVTLVCYVSMGVLFLVQIIAS